MTAGEERVLRRDRVDELLRQIDAQRRQRLLLEAAGAYAPGLERESEQTREQLARLVTDW